jgi:hypothetical protein
MKTQIKFYRVEVLSNPLILITLPRRIRQNLFSNRIYHTDSTKIIPNSFGVQCHTVHLLKLPVLNAEKQSPEF